MLLIINLVILGGYSQEFVVGVCCLAAQILTLDIISDEYP